MDKRKKNIIITLIIVFLLFVIMILYINQYNLQTPKSFAGLFFGFLIVTGLLLRILFDEQIKKLKKRK